MKLRNLVVSYFFLFLIFVPWRSAVAGDYILSTYEAAPGRSYMHIKSPSRLRCDQLFSNVRSELSVRVQQVASFSIDEHGNRDDANRGYRLAEQSINDFDKITEGVLRRILNDWQRQHGFSQAEIQSIYGLHQKLNRKRTKFLTIESNDKTLFSGLRIYDSSPEMKDRGQLWRGEDEPIDTKEVAERVFPHLDLNQLFAKIGVKRERFTWSLGLLDISRNQEKALHTLLAQTADLLDLHYNGREYLNFQKLTDIQREDVDIIFYSNARLKQYYQRVLKTEPVKDEKSKDIVLTPSSAKNGAPSEFYLFRLKGSEFISRFMKMEYHEPMFASNKAYRRQEELYQYLRAKIQPIYDRLNPDQYRVKDLPDVLRRTKAIFDPVMRGLKNGTKPSEDQFWTAVAQVFMLRRNLPPGVFENWRTSEVMYELNAIASSPMGSFVIGSAGQGITAGEMLNRTVLAGIEMVYNDPMLFLINRSHLNLTK